MDAERVLQTLEGWACSEYQLPEDGEGEEDAQQQQPKQPQKQRLTGRKRARQDTILRGLDFLMQDERDKLDNAIQILDDGKLRALKASPSGRKVHTVSGSFKKTYFCVRDYCSCESYFQLARKPTAGRVMCKHLLAIRLSPMLLGHREESTISDKELASILHGHAFT